MNEGREEQGEKRGGEGFRQSADGSEQHRHQYSVDVEVPGKAVEAVRDDGSDEGVETEGCGGDKILYQSG